MRNKDGIPFGYYCYDEEGICKYWTIDKTKPPQMNGYCGFLKSGDSDVEGISLLWDQCKECGINIGEENELVELKD
jgi:hypothetical protein